MAVTALRSHAAEELQQLLDVEGSGFPGLNWVRLSLQAPGKLLSTDNRGGFAWGLLPLLVIDAAGGDPRTGLPLAAAAECLITASDVLDDVQDGDSPWGLEHACGVATAINVGAFLGCMAQVAIHRLTDLGFPADVVRDVGRVLANAAARACGGQQRDIDQDDALLTECGYLEMVEAKSGALVEGLCRAAAIVAGASADAIEGYAQFGRNLGIALQINNDVRAVSVHQDERNDIAAAKRTLPLVFALEHAPELTYELVAAAHVGQPASYDAQRLGDVVHRTGGVLYASVVADVHFEEASASLNQAGCPARSQLRALLRSMRQ
jgi:geranylgeranyl diphosphate synthase, type I